MRRLCVPLLASLIVLCAAPAFAARLEVLPGNVSARPGDRLRLVAIAWIGRDTFDAAELEEAIETAKAEKTSPTEDYLLGMPHLSDYLEAGLEALGHNVEEAGEGIF